jgi:hypothetical protein
LRTNKYRHFVKVEMHLNGGFTRVQGISPDGVPLLGVCVDIPTNTIPSDLRTLGSRFFIDYEDLWPEDADTVDQIREALATNTKVSRE